MSEFLMRYIFAFCLIACHSINIDADSINVVDIGGDSAITGQSSFNGPAGLIVDQGGNVIIADTKNHAIKSLSLNGTISLLLGSLMDPVVLDDPRSTPQSLLFPMGLAFDSLQNILIADYGRHSIKRLNKITGEVSIVAGDTQGYLDGPDTIARFNFPTAIRVDENDNIYVTDFLNNCIRKIAASGHVSTFAGSSIVGFVDGAGTFAQFNGPTGIAVDNQHHIIYIADFNNHAIRKILLSTGAVETIAGRNDAGYLDGSATASLFRNPFGLALTNSNSILYISDYGNNFIRIIDISANLVETLPIGNISVTAFRKPAGLALDSSGHIYVADSGNNRIRKIVICSASSQFYDKDASCVVPGAINCPLGEEAVRFRTQCAPCLAGWFRPSFDFQNCIECPQGAICTATQLKCGFGYTPSKQHQFSCDKCADGYIKTAISNIECAPCLGGAYSNENNTECILCPKGTYKLISKNRCDKCLIGFESNNGRTGCIACNTPKYYRPTLESDDCIECPDGAFCSATDFKCKDGYEINASGKGCLQIRSNSTTDTMMGLTVFEITVIALGTFLLTTLLGLFVLYQNRLREIKDNKKKMEFYELYSKQAEMANSRMVLNNPFTNNAPADLRIKTSPPASVYNSQQVTPMTATMPDTTAVRWSISMNK